LIIPKHSFVQFVQELLISFIVESAVARIERGLEGVINNDRFDDDYFDK